MNNCYVIVCNNWVEVSSDNMQRDMHFVLLSPIYITGFDPELTGQSKSQNRDLIGKRISGPMLILIPGTSISDSSVNSVSYR